MINTTTSPFILESGSEQQFDGSSIICHPTYIELQELFSVQLNIISSTTTSVIAYGQISVTKTEVDAESGTGTGETAPWFNALQKAVITKLSAISGNGSVVFSIV